STSRYSRRKSADLRHSTPCTHSAAGTTLDHWSQTLRRLLRPSSLLHSPRLRCRSLHRPTPLHRLSELLTALRTDTATLPGRRCLRACSGSRRVGAVSRFLRPLLRSPPPSQCRTQALLAFGRHAAFA